MAFLEFLAEMEEVDGKLVSASDLLELNQQAANNKGQTTAEQLAILKLLQEIEPATDGADKTITDAKSLAGTNEKQQTNNKKEDKQ